MTELIDIARGIAREARPGEQLEAYVARSEQTDVEVFGGEVESLTTAGVEGVGVRVIVDQRQGLAWAGSLDPEVIAETVRDARDNAMFGEPDEFYGLASPDEVERPPRPALDVWREELAGVSVADKVALALELERATKAADARIRNVEAASYGDARVRSRAREFARCRGVHAAHDVLGIVGRDCRRRRGRADRLRLRRRAYRRRPRSRIDSPRRGDARVPDARRRADQEPPVAGDPRSARDAIHARCAVERVQR